jgi:hypothetical protein
MALMGMLMLKAMSPLRNAGPDYSAHVQALRVLESRMKWVTTGSGTSIYITGMLTNQSEFAWKEIEFECRFMDGNGRLVDAAHPHAELTILPHDDAAFRASMSPSGATNDYVG